MKLVTTIKILNLDNDPEVFEDGELYFNKNTNKIRLSYDGLWSNLVDDENLELLFARRVTEVKDLEQNFSYIITTQDQNSVLISNSASHVDFIIPNNSTYSIDIGTSIKVVRGNIGEINFIEESGVVLRTPDENYLNSVWNTIDLLKINTNEWILEGEFPDLY
jgi:ABC-type antimicrobial peptide transport system ATPase subunit